MRDLPLMFVATLTLVTATPADAGVFADDLSRCLVNKTTDYDQLHLKKWLFSAFSMDPALAPLSSIDAGQRAKIRSAAAAVYNRLLFSDCRREAILALKNEGSNAIIPAFGVLGRATAQQIFKSPQADAEFTRFGESFDKVEIKKLFAEGGVPTDD